MYKVYISDGNEPIEIKLTTISQVLDLITLLNMPSNPNVQATIMYIGVNIK